MNQQADGRMSGSRKQQLNGPEMLDRSDKYSTAVCCVQGLEYGSGVNLVLDGYVVPLARSTCYPEPGLLLVVCTCLPHMASKVDSNYGSAFIHWSSRDSCCHYLAQLSRVELAGRPVERWPVCGGLRAFKEDLLYVSLSPEDTYHETKNCGVLKIT
ncbi:hypothetical protein CBL_12008 [Carabus blaptoides fortunei]